MPTNKTLLITFGCSWTYGVGVGYSDNMSLSEYKKIAWNLDSCNQQSFRAIISKKYNLDNKNFSAGGSSNQKQFRLAKNFFSSKEFDQYKLDYNKIVVLWGITSTARNEMFDSQNQQLTNFFLNEPIDIAKSLLNYVYDQEQEIWTLAQDMIHWNNYFKLLDIENFWFDTFNHHDYSKPSPGIYKLKEQYTSVAGKDWPSWEDYTNQKFSNNDTIKREILDSSRFDFASLVNPVAVDRIIFHNDPARDLMSKLAISTGLTIIDDAYHESDWKIDSERVSHLIKNKVLNPHSFHPTQLGHQMIADIIDHEIGCIF